MLNGYWLSIWGDDTVWELDSGESGTTLETYLMSLNYAL